MPDVFERPAARVVASRPPPSDDASPALAASLHSWNGVRSEEDVIENHRPPSPLRCRILIAGLWAISAVACRPLVMTPAARKVAVARSSSEVEECKPRGKVFALAPFPEGQDPVDQLRIRAEVIGADTVLIGQKRDQSAQTGDWQARAYRCAQSEKERVADARPVLEANAPR